MKLVFGIFFLLSGIIVATDLVRREGRKPRAIKVIRCSVVLITPLFLFLFFKEPIRAAVQMGREAETKAINETDTKAKGKYD